MDHVSLLEMVLSDVLPNIPGWFDSCRTYLNWVGMVGSLLNDLITCLTDLDGKISPMN